MKAIDLDGSMLKNLKPREAASHKGTYGKVAVIGGSKTMVGAAAFAAFRLTPHFGEMCRLTERSMDEMKQQSAAERNKVSV